MWIHDFCHPNVTRWLIYLKNKHHIIFIFEGLHLGIYSLDNWAYCVKFSHCSYSLFFSIHVSSQAFPISDAKTENVGIWGVRRKVNRAVCLLHTFIYTVTHAAIGANGIFAPQVESWCPSEGTFARHTNNLEIPASEV